MLCEIYDKLKGSFDRQSLSESIEIEPTSLVLTEASTVQEIRPWGNLALLLLGEKFPVIIIL